MIESTRKEFGIVLAGVFTLYGKQLSPALFGIWWESMRPYDFAAVKDALNRHAVNPDNGQFLPKPADVVKLIGGGTLDAALVAWSKVDRAVRSVGTYESVCFDDALINAVLRDMGGWVMFGTKTEDEWPFVAREFENRYRGYCTRGRVPDYPRYLAGIHERDNSQQGFDTRAPVLIGDQAVAQRVFEGGNAKPALEYARALLTHEEAA